MKGISNVSMITIDYDKVTSTYAQQDVDDHKHFILYFEIQIR